MDEAKHQGFNVWARPGELDKYDQALAMLESGKRNAAVRMLDQLSRKPIRVAPDGAWDNDLKKYYGVFLSRSFCPAVALLRKVWAANSRYADELSRAGRRQEALRVLAVNARMARQMVQLLPPDDSAGLVSGNTLWQSAWNAIATNLAATGHRAEAAEAAACAARADLFRSRIKVWAAESRGRTERLRRDVSRLSGDRRSKLENEGVLQLVRRDALEIRELIREWDTAVDGKACTRLLAEISGGQ